MTKMHYKAKHGESKCVDLPSSVLEEKSHLIFDLASQRTPQAGQDKRLCPGLTINKRPRPCYSPSLHLSLRPSAIGHLNNLVFAGFVMIIGF